VVPNDWELVQRTRQGDREAFRILVERYQRKVAALALGMLRNPDDAMDVVQDTFTKAYQSLERFKGDASFYTWIYRIAVNLCIDVQRRDAKMLSSAREPRDGDDEGDAELPAAVLHGTEPEDPFQRVRDAELARGIREAVAELTPEHRAVIVLREVDGLSYEEISRVLDCPKGTVMSRLHYARKQLQARLRRLR
jgi:RNA polymerase sigma-70 factor (ECF subfamily)